MHTHRGVYRGFYDHVSSNSKGTIRFHKKEEERMFRTRKMLGRRDRENQQTMGCQDASGLGGVYG